MAKVLLLEIGAGALPAATPVVVPSGDWFPKPYEAPPAAAPAMFVVTPVLGGVRLTWNASAEPRATYEVERAPDDAGLPGVAKVVYTGADTTFNSNESGRTHWRVRVKVRGKPGAWTAWSAQSPDDPLNYVGGNGVNLLPDQLSTLESPTLPAATNYGLTIARTTVAANTKVGSGGAWQLTRSGAGTTEGYLYLGNGLNVPRTPGKKYIVSFWYKTSAASFQKNHDLFVWDGVSSHIGTGWTCIADGTFRRAAVLIDPTSYASQAMMFRVDFDTATLGDTIYLDGFMVEEAIGNKVEASAYTRGTANGLSLAALLAAQNAQATADNLINIYRQPTAPAIGGAGASLGDYWQDSDDGRWWYCNGSSWIESTDNRLPQALLDAAAAHGAANTAQVTANTRIRLFPQDATPTATPFIVGDTWYRPSYRETFYWNGSGWSKSADDFASATDSLVFNPSFEQADLYWSRDPGLYTETNPAALSGSQIMVFSASLGNPNARAVGAKSIQVRPGQVLSVIGCIGRWQNIANGEGAIGLVFYDKDGAFIGEKNIAWSTAPSTGQKADAYWRTVTGKITVPYGAVRAHANLIVTGCTAGFWVFDNIRLAFADDQPRAVGSGESFVPNGNFGQNKGQFPIAQYAAIQGEFVADGWMNDSVGGGYTGAVAVGLEAYATGNQTQLFIGDAGGIVATPGSNQVYVRSGDRFAVEPGEKFIVRSEGVVDIGTPRPAGIDIFTYVGLNFYNKDGADIGYGGRQAINHSGYWLAENLVTIPAGTAYVRPIVGVQWNNTTGANVMMPWATTHARFRQCNIRRQTTLDQNVITDGTTYGRTANVDLAMDGGVRRIGLNVRGSRVILAGARNSRASIVGGVAAVRNVTALSANSSGQVTVNAHTLDISGEVVTYNAVTNAVVGLTQGVTYVIFTLDPFLDGGTRTYYAQTSVLTAQQSGEGAVFIGNIKIPTTGTGTGGGPGTGNPGDWCVDIETVLPDGRLVRGLQVGDLVPCIDVRVPGAEVELHQVRAISIGEEACYRLVTTSLASIVQSASTPMDLPDGRIKRTPEMLGQRVLVQRAGQLTEELVCDLQFVGRRQVLKVDLGNRMFLAGESAQAVIATHNAQYKP